MLHVLNSQISFYAILTSLCERPKNFTGVIKFPNGDKIWYSNRQYHRTNGPAVECPNGDKYWYLNGRRHRTDGPAIEKVDAKQWFLNGKCHRIDGPAIECSDGNKYWWLNGKYYYSKKDWEKEIEKLSDESVK